MTTQQSVHDQAGYIYGSVFEEIRVSPNGERWDVRDGPLVGTVDAAVLDDIDANYDMPVLRVDGSYWSN